MFHLTAKWKSFKQSLRKRGGLKRSFKLIGIVLQEKGVRGLIKHILMLKNELKSKNRVTQWQKTFAKKEIMPSVLKYKNAYMLSLNNTDTSLPLVSIILVNYNGREHLDELLNSIYRQSYNNIEVIVVDNGSTDGSTEYIKKNFSQVSVLIQQQNLGFSKAVNLAADTAQGRYFCLFNNDMVLDKDAVSNLYQCLSHDETISAAGSKIRFYKKFITVRITLKTSGKVYLDLDALRQSLKIYPKILFTDYLLKLTLFNQQECHEFEKVTEFKIPITHGQVRPVFRFYCDKNNEITIKANGFEQKIECKAKKWIQIHSDMLDTLKNAQWLINNAGSFIETDLSAGDRGFGLYDQGQFDLPELVEALCGGALMLKPEVLASKPVFSEHFFVYYEDTDLSFRIRKAGYNVSFCPQSVVYHKHASTSSQHPALYQYYTIRNRLLFIKLHYSEEIFLQYYRQQVNELQQNNPELLLDLDDKLDLIEKNKFY